MMASWVVIRLVVTGKRIGEMRCINLVAVWLRKDTHNGFLRVKVNVQKRYWKLKVNYRKIESLLSKSRLVLSWLKWFNHP